MTEKEWQKLCRKTKNDETYYQLINSIIRCSKYLNITINEFIKRYTYHEIMAWYKDYRNTFMNN